MSYVAGFMTARSVVPRRPIRHPPSTSSSSSPFRSAFLVASSPSQYTTLFIHTRTYKQTCRTTWRRRRRRRRQLHLTTCTRYFTRTSFIPRSAPRFLFSSLYVTDSTCAWRATTSRILRVTFAIKTFSFHIISARIFSCNSIKRPHWCLENIL